MSRNRLFVGFSTNNVKPGNTKTTLYDLALIKQDLLNQFMTPKGQRIMLPNYGSIIWDQLFEPYTNATRNLIVQDVLRIINSEPRVTMEDIQVYETLHGLAIAVKLFYPSWDIVDSLSVAFDNENKV